MHLEGKCVKRLLGIMALVNLDPTNRGKMANRTLPDKRTAVQSVKSSAVLAPTQFEDIRTLFRVSRVDAGLDIETLATNAHVPAATVVLLETVPHKVRLEDLYAVANALNLDPGIVLDRLHSESR